MLDMLFSPTAANRVPSESRATPIEIVTVMSPSDAEGRPSIAKRISYDDDPHGLL